jgi:hypothetical protein
MTATHKGFDDLPELLSKTQRKREKTKPRGSWAIARPSSYWENASGGDSKLCIKCVIRLSEEP